jgi:hypothetical protein
MPSQARAWQAACHEQSYPFGYAIKCGHTDQARGYGGSDTAQEAPGMRRKPASLKSSSKPNTRSIRRDFMIPKLMQSV